MPSAARRRPDAGHNRATGTAAAGGAAVTQAHAWWHFRQTASAFSDILDYLDYEG
ncbi:hypothetical protein MSM1_03660 [Mycobacterium sp. SM1]|uniref:hypothetical protein n=1 Tax=Mycobacterium sp. SM1 TaxID=2816243 RepID=UPI001BCAD92F|nr:hypothetical protein [Mycobacterium sp. SM1]MBS4727488.1 hypothetical protein [Mycobacterium sp. SM1]